MAKGKKTGGKNFGPGNNANPKGRPKLTEEIRSLRDLTREQLTGILSKIVKKDIATLELMAKDKSLGAIEAIAISCVLRARSTGKWEEVDGMLTRIGTIGKPKDTLEVTGSIHAQLVDLVKERGGG